MGGKVLTIEFHSLPRSKIVKLAPGDWGTLAHRYGVLRVAQAVLGLGKCGLHWNISGFRKERGEEFAAPLISSKY